MVNWTGARRCRDAQSWDSVFQRGTARVNQKYQAFLTHKPLSFCPLPVNNKLKGQILLIQPQKIPVTSIVSVRYQRVVVRAPGADVELRFSARRAGCLPPSRSPWYRFSEVAVRSNSSPKHSGYIYRTERRPEGIMGESWRESERWARRLVAAPLVAMDHLNSLCCIHEGWEQRYVHVPSEI